MISSTERKHRYDMMGVVAYAEERIKMFLEEKGKAPDIVIMGKLEWVEILGCKLDEEFSVAGIPVVPDLTRPQGVFLR